MSGQNAISSKLINIRLGYSSNPKVPIRARHVARVVEKKDNGLAYSRCFIPARSVLIGMTEQKKSLDPREREILSLVAAGKSDAEIGIILNLSPKTVNYHVEKAKKKFDATRRIQLIAAVIRSGEID